MQLTRTNKSQPQEKHEISKDSDICYEKGECSLPAAFPTIN